MPLQTSRARSFRLRSAFAECRRLRFWEFEDAQVDFGSVDAGPTDLARMLLVEFALAYGNDWFVIPIELDVGSLYRTRSLVITDTFGVRTLIKPSSELGAPHSTWRMFQHSFCEEADSLGQRRICFSCPRRCSRVWRADPLKRCCSCATRWRISPGRLNVWLKAPPTDRSTDLKLTWNRNDGANRNRPHGRGQRRRHCVTG